MGTIHSPQSTGLAAAGALVRKGDPICAVTPILSPERSVLTASEQVRLAEARNALAAAIVAAESDIGKATVEMASAQRALDRAAQLLEDKAGSERARDEAEAQLNLAKQSVKAATARRDLLAGTNLKTEAGDTTPLILTAPFDGMVRNKFATDGQAVASGAPLYELIDARVLWVRVPVYVGDMEAIDPQQPANVNVSRDSGIIAGQPVAAPPSANVNAATVDLYYEIDTSKSSAIVPGQRVTVSLAQRGEDESLVAPWAAIVQDVYGGAWVYRKDSSQVYSRSRVVVRYVDGDLAVLATGPAPGTEIVTDGAAELFGTEFGTGK